MGRGKKFNDKEKWCNKCRRWLPLGDFQFSAYTASKKQTFCATCISGKERRKQTGYVYVIGNAALQKFKIGSSVNPEKRLAVMQMHSPAILELVQKIKVEDMWQTERDFHEILLPRHSHGEWFTLTLEEAKNIDSFRG